MTQFNRLSLYFGDQLSLIQNMSVCIIGLGGVGGSVVEMLARFGVGHLILIDADTIDETNLNRQLISLHSNLGAFKAEEFKKRILDINPLCRVDVHNVFVNKDNMATVLDQYLLDYVVDAIDSIPAKIEIARYCQLKKIGLIASCGMGNRLDPTKVVITKLSRTFNDPMAKRMRELVKKERLQDIMVVASSELPLKRALPPASIPYVVNMAGLLASYYVINERIKDVSQK